MDLGNLLIGCVFGELRRIDFAQFGFLCIYLLLQLSCWSVLAALV